MGPHRRCRHRRRRLARQDRCAAGHHGEVPRSGHPRHRRGSDQPRRARHGGAAPQGTVRLRAGRVRDRDGREQDARRRHHAGPHPVVQVRHSLTGAVISVLPGTSLAALVERDDNWIDCTGWAEWLAAEREHLAAVAEWLDAEQAHNDEGAGNAGDASGRTGRAAGSTTSRPGRGADGRKRAAAGSKRPRSGAPVAVGGTDADTAADIAGSGGDGRGGPDAADGDPAGNAKPAS
ncbi:hypothetical protein I5H01_gp094 [Mycobacterium phage MarkPhew]|uniref:Uncharacterized protein n=1 Tax=Mycobacterium phage MarkPhew TaxID=2725625 RepID=A0A6M3SWF7_9CAUD|nr:hypothetical protein I5H01_gp094 [Mycobacterium phage MarkPhew]